MAKAHSFFRELQQLPLPTGEFSKVGHLNDMHRLLQTLTNTAFVENKNHNMLTKHAVHEEQMMFGESSATAGLAPGVMPGKSHLLSRQTHF